MTNESETNKLDAEAVEPKRKAAGKPSLGRNVAYKSKNAAPGQDRKQR